MAQPIQPIFTLIGLDWLCYLAGNFLSAPRIFFCFNILFFIYFFKYETIETQAHAFLTLNILAIGRVWYFAQRPEFSWWFDLLIYLKR